MFALVALAATGWSAGGGLVVGRASRVAPIVACAPTGITVRHFLEDLEFLGPCRFVVVGPGAILEGIGAFES